MLQERAEREREEREERERKMAEVEAHGRAGVAAVLEAVRGHNLAAAQQVSEDVLCVCFGLLAPCTRFGVCV